MFEKENLQVVQEWISAINAHDADRLAATLNEDFIWELGESSSTGRDVSKEAWSLWFVAFPDLRFEVTGGCSGFCVNGDNQLNL